VATPPPLYTLRGNPDLRKQVKTIQLIDQNLLKPQLSGNSEDNPTLYH
jgi:hypothetical protein